MEVKVQTFKEFLPGAFENGQYTTDDVIAFLIPLFKEVLSFHEGHHDAQIDIFCLGLILGSIALSLDLHAEEDLEMFVTHRGNPSRLNARIHPTVSTLIREMTELDRNKRAQDLYDVIHRLEH